MVIQTTYHMSDKPLPLGTILNPGIWGEKIHKHVIKLDYPQFIKEEIFEDVRRKLFMHAPSRYDCVYLFPDIISARFYRASWKRYKAFIYETNIIDGSQYIVDMSFLNCNGGHYADIKKQAEKYWSKLHHPDSCTLEILLNGKAEIMNLVAEPSVL